MSKPAPIYNMECQITIGNVILKKVSSASIVASVKDLSDTATLVLPRNISQFNGKKSLLESIKIDDKVEIKLGYNGMLFREFEGYVKNIGASEPIELELEDEMYILRKKKLKGKHYTTTSIQEILKEYFSEYELVLDNFNVNLVSFRIDNDVSAFDLLHHLKENYPVDFYFKNGTDPLKPALYFTYNYSEVPTAYKVYHLEKNVVKNELKHIVSSARKARIKAISKLRNGKTISVTFGDSDAKANTLNFAHIETEKELERLAKAELEKIKNNEFSGKIKGFGFPRTQSGEGLEIQSKKNPDRNGKFLIDKVTITFNESGYRRENEISKKISV